MIYVGNYLSTPPAAFCSSPVSQAKQLSAELCCRPLTSISRDCSNCCILRCCSRICRPLIRNVGAAAVMNYLSFWSLRDECVWELLTVSRTIEVFVSWHQEILICKYLRSSCCTFPHIITLSSQQSTFKHFCHPPLSARPDSGSGIYSGAGAGSWRVSSFTKIYKSAHDVCGPKLNRWEKLNIWTSCMTWCTLHSYNFSERFHHIWKTLFRIDHQEG